MFNYVGQKNFLFSRETGSVGRLETEYFFGVAFFFCFETDDQARSLIPYNALRRTWDCMGILSRQCVCFVLNVLKI